MLHEKIIAAMSIKLNEQKRINNRKATTTLYSTDIEYSYSVNGKEYSSNKIKWVDHRSNNQKLHNSMLDKYPQNAKVKVFYNPKKPEVGLLEPGLSAGNFIGFLFFAIALASMTLVLASKL